MYQDSQLEPCWKLGILLRTPQAKPVIKNNILHIPIPKPDMSYRTSNAVKHQKDIIICLKVADSGTWPSMGRDRGDDHLVEEQGFYTQRRV
jgi:hypothetical protein